MIKIIGLDKISRTALTESTEELYSCDWSNNGDSSTGYNLDNIVLDNGNSLSASDKKTLWDKYLIKRQSVEALEELYHKRRVGYGSVGDQLDMMMKDMRDGTTTHQTACEAVKTAHPKPE
jgi:hypothetical protein